MNAKIARDLIASAARLHQAGQLEQAEKIYQQVLIVRPNQADAVHLLGVIACQRQQLDRGLELISRAILLSPTTGEYHNSLGNVLSGLKRMEEAIASYRRAYELDPKNLAALNNLAMALGHEDFTAESLALFDRLIAIKNDVGPWHTNRGGIQYNAGMLTAAIESQRRAIALQPDLAGAHTKLATALLSLGQFAEGWKEYTWRFVGGATANPALEDAAPVWDGSPIAGKTLLVQGEQGLGDVLQCARYLPLIAEQGVTVIVRCKPSLKMLLGRVAGVAQTLSVGEPIPPHDLQVPIFSLPLIFQTDEQTIPRAIPYLFADENKAKKYGGGGSVKRVGLAWAGSEEHGNNRRRSCPAEALNALAGIENIEFHRLQLPRTLPGPSGLTLIDHTVELHDFDDTAALVSNLDLVISVDTSIVHLAGAMGKPVWVLLPFAAEWRWLTQREDSPWYPTARLFRQTSAGDWNGVMQRVRSVLEAMAIPT